MIGSMTRLGTTAMLAGAPFSSAMPAGATLKPCQKGVIFGVGRGPSGSVAMNKAIQNWRISTEDAYGSYFSDWHNATNHRRSCKVADGLFYCRVWAQACKSEKPTSPSMQPCPICIGIKWG